MNIRRSASVIVVVAVLIGTLTGCGGDDDDAAAPTPTVEPTATAAPDPTPEPEPTPTVGETPEPTATSEPTPTSAPTSPPEPTPTPELPGEPFDVGVPAPGEIVAVVGVAFDDILEVHAQPGENTPLVAQLPNLADDVVGTGQGRLLPASIWWLIERNGIEGWVGSGFMGRLGAVVDLTSEVVASNGGVIPGAETMLDLGQIVADLVASDDPPSRIVVSVAPTVGDLGEITMDVVGLGDDALRGYRLHVFGQTDESFEGFGLASVEATLICGRGVTDDGFCI